MKRTFSTQNVGFTKGPLTVASIEKLRAPLKLKKKRADFLYNLYREPGKNKKSTLLKEKEVLETPKRVRAYTNPQKKGVSEVWMYSIQNPLVERLYLLKQEKTQSQTLHEHFWLPNLYLLDNYAFDTKMITYCLNEQHVEGKEKAFSFKKNAGFVKDSDSINKLYDFLCRRLYNYETPLYQI